MISEFDSQLQNVTSRLTQGMPEKLAASIHYSVLGTGKRIRPRLVLAASKLFEIDPEVSLHVACALEMAHAYTLIHDDLPCMDDDDLRRGVPTNHKVHGESTALLAGDALVLLAHESLFLNEGLVSPTRLLKSVQILNHAMGGFGVIAGQALEEDLKRISHPKLLERVFQLKTGAFFKACLLIPGALAGFYEEKATAKINALESWGGALGVAFQIADDLEDEPHAHLMDPAHSLHYWSREEAQMHALKTLDSSADQLQSVWGDSCSALLVFGQEIRKKLGHPSS